MVRAIRPMLEEILRFARYGPGEPLGNGGLPRGFRNLRGPDCAGLYLSLLYILVLRAISFHLSFSTLEALFSRRWER